MPLGGIARATLSACETGDLPLIPMFLVSSFSPWHFIFQNYSELAYVTSLLIRNLPIIFSVCVPPSGSLVLPFLCYKKRTVIFMECTNRPGSSLENVRDWKCFLNFVLSPIFSALPIEWFYNHVKFSVW